jgi:hypothetical protein
MSKLESRLLQRGKKWNKREPESDGCIHCHAKHAPLDVRLFITIPWSDLIA